METKIIVIDDFFDEPDLVVDYALSLNYEKHKTATYPGKNSRTGLWHQPLRKRLESIIGNEISPSPGMSNGLFRLSAESDPFEQNIHVDPGSDWAGVLYLNKHHPHNLDGTCFWQHNQFGFEECPKDAETAQSYGFNSFDEIRQQIILTDGLDRSLWKCVYRVPYKYNRLVLFRPWLFHSHGENFGDWSNDFGTQRLIQLFFLRERNGFHGIQNGGHLSNHAPSNHTQEAQDLTPINLNHALECLKKHQSNPINKQRRHHPALDSNMLITDVKTVVPRFWLYNFKEYSKHYEKHYRLPNAID